MGNGRYCPNAAMISLQITVTLHLTLRVAFAIVPLVRTSVRCYPNQTICERYQLVAMRAEKSGLPRRRQRCERIAREAVEDLFFLREGAQA